jgi:hypothetical protein
VNSVSYLPDTIDRAKVLITVKTYPLPSNKYEELVCTAGVLEDGRWIRIYPIPFRSLPRDKKFEKYEWIELDLVRNMKDFRQESYRPKSHSNIRILGKIGTEHGWTERKKYVLKEVFTSFDELIRQAKGRSKKSLATFRPREIVDFKIEDDARTWKEQWLAHLNQYDMFQEIDAKGEGVLRKIADKVPYKYSYQFFCEGERKPRTLMIEDWEIGALYWHCLSQAEGDEEEANRLVRKKYFEEFLMKKDLYLFVGTTRQYHDVAPNPFVIIGVFYPPTQKDYGQQSLFPGY